MSNQQGRRRDVWRNQERHYCAVCNTWMGGDRQSILLHENGRKHKEAVAAAEKEKRAERKQQEAQAAMLAQSLQQIERAAQKSQAADLGLFAGTAATVSHHQYYTSQNPAPVVTSSSLPPTPHAAEKNDKTETPGNKQQERKEWEARKQHRKEEKEASRRKRDGQESSEDEEKLQNNRRKRRRRIGPEEGFYSHGNVINEDSNSVNHKTYLEGSVFGEGIVEEECPIQLWTGAAAASDAEKRMPECNLYWKDGLVAAVRMRKRKPKTNLLRTARKQVTVSMALPSAGGIVKPEPQRSSDPIPTENFSSNNSVSSNNNAGDNNNNEEPELEMVVDVAFLQTPDDTDETLETSVPLDRIRIVLGANDKDGIIPDTLEEARILATGGEEEEETTLEAANDNNSSVVDENTGLSSWSTVHVQRTTVQLERKRERIRQRQQERQAARKAQAAARDAEARRMEEAKVANADDSALGAYDVWSRGTKEGYKGVPIQDDGNGNTDATVSELGKQLSEGKSAVTFHKKKSAFKLKQKKKKQNRRTTSADDD